jgi:uncharacterized protein YjbI with pentapeptide repeats
MNQGWKNYLLYSSAVLFIGGLIYILVETIKVKNTGFETKTLWDWMELLIVPLVLAGGAFFLNRSERNTEREIAADRQQEEALQTYFDRMSELLLKEKLRTTKKAEVRDVARTRTLSVLRVLDKKRKGHILLFLYEARLIIKGNPRISIKGADFSGADLTSTKLSGVDLSDTNLMDADLTGANLNGANLSNAQLVSASLFDANLHNANLKNTNLNMTNLLLANLSGANLEGAELIGADLSEAFLTGTNLKLSNFRLANLKDANLIDADLTDAIISTKQLASAKSLQGATLPDGTKHE